MGSGFLSGRIFIITGFLFFLCIILSEIDSELIPEKFKTSIIESSIITELSDIGNSLNALELDRTSDLPDTQLKDFQTPLFLFKNKELIYWNSIEDKIPSDLANKRKSGIYYTDYGISKNLNVVRVYDNGLMAVSVIMLWKDVGIENDWIKPGTQFMRNLNWEIASSESCANKMIISDEINFNICFNKASSKLLSNVEILRFITFIFGILFFLISATELTKLLGKARLNQIVIFHNFFISSLIFLLLYEYLRRFFLPSDKESLFFVIYPFLLALSVFFIVRSSYLLNTSWIVKKVLKNDLIKIILVFGIYLLAKSYWKEVFDKEEYDLNLINFIRLEWNTLYAFFGLFGMSIFFYISESFLLSLFDKSGIKRMVRISLLIALFLLISNFIFSSEIYFGYIILAGLIFFGLKRQDFINLKILQRSLPFYVIVIFLFSLLIAETTYWGNLEKEKKLLKRYANSEWKNDFYTSQKLIKEAIEKIKSDKLTILSFKSPLVSKDIINQKIKKVYLDSYFDPFEVNIDFLDANGDNLNSDLGFQNFYYFKSNYLKSDYKVGEGLYLFNGDYSKDLNFISHIKIISDEVLLGHLIIEIYKDESTPYSIFPKLLVDRKYSKGDYWKNFEHQVFDQKELTAFLNSLDVDRDLNLKNDVFINRKTGNYLIRKKGEKVEVNIKHAETDLSPFSNFSITFLVLSVLTLFTLIFIKPEKLFKVEELPIQNKIQYFMNLAFLLPLIFVSLSVLKFMSDNEKQNVESNYLEKIKVIASDVQIPFLDFTNKIIPKRVFQERASNAAGSFDLDYFIYDKKGLLESSSKEIIWERGIENKLIEPEAFTFFKTSDQNFFIQESKLGKFEYKTAHAVLFDLNKKKIGYLSVPFYESSEELESRFILLLSTVINVFVLTFVIFLFLSGRLTKRLMIPILKLSDRIKITSFQNQNEPLEWDIDDEIGLLVRSYNEMIEKLNESRIALARTEKEAAWKEMAQQVAHEIKNPLTPMKLRLQQLIRKKENEKNREVLESLLHQVETLSEIASSFSEFARMPNPKNEILDISELIKRSSEIYKGRDNVQLKLDVPNEKIFIKADKNMLGSSIGNIILNAIQSVEDKTAIISVLLKKEENNVILSIKDNGIGINEDIRDRIFIPHFSTKSGGTGIGLALAKKTIDASGGKIEFQSDPGFGTTFIISIPVIDHQSSS